jgi:hypothetical protein
MPTRIIAAWCQTGRSSAARCGFLPVRRSRRESEFSDLDRPLDLSVRWKKLKGVGPLPNLPRGVVDRDPDELEPGLELAHAGSRVRADGAAS